MSQIRIQVNEADIAKAEKNNSMRCVVAQAIARTLPDATRIDVDTQSIRWSREGERFVYMTPYSVQGYVVAFDAGEPIQPFTFALDSRKRVPVQTARKTEAGKAIGKARKQERSAAKRAEKLERTAKKATLPPPSPGEVKAAKALLPDARQAATEATADVAKVTAAYEGAVQMRREGEGRVAAPPRVTKSSERHYGMRTLRVNR